MRNRPRALNQLAAPTATAPLEYIFNWTGVDAFETARRGTVVAANSRAARAVLRQRGLYVLDLRQRRAVKPVRLTSAEATALARQLASLLTAGLPLLNTLELIADGHPRPDVGRLLRALAADIARGQTFSAALSRYPRSFDPLYCQLVAIGEATGTLAATLGQLADDRKRASAQKSRMRAALAYPAGILVLSLAVTISLLVGVVPTFAEVFESFGAPLPVPTLAVLRASAWVQHNGASAAAVLAALGLTARGMLRRSARLRLKGDRLLLRLPGLGKLLQQFAVARWSRALSTLLQAGIPVTEALQALVHTTGRPVFDDAMHQMVERLRSGETLAASMRAAGCFPATLVQLTEVGEQASALSRMLGDMAHLSESQLDEAIGMLTQLAEPAVVAVLGLLIGALVVAMYLPIIELGNVV